MKVGRGEGVVGVVWRLGGVFNEGVKMCRSHVIRRLLFFEWLIVYTHTQHWLWVGEWGVDGMLPGYL